MPGMGEGKYIGRSFYTAEQGLGMVAQVRLVAVRIKPKAVAVAR